MSIELVAIGIALPPNIMTNEMVAEKMNAAGARTSKKELMTAEWFKKVLIEERRYADDAQNNSDFARIAANEALNEEGIWWDNLRIIASATSSPELWFASIPCLAMQKDKVKEGPMAFDLLAACTGTVYAIDIVNAMLMAHAEWEYGLVMASEIISRNLDFSDPNSGLFGEGGGALLFKKTANPNRGFICSVSGTRPEEADLAYSQGRSNRTGCDYAHPNFYFNGHQVHSFVLTILEEAINKIVEKADISIEDIDLIVPHQANGRIIDNPAKKLGISPDKFFINIAKYGNTSTVSIPLALYEAKKQGRLKPDTLVVLVGFGSGLTWGAILMRI